MRAAIRAATLVATLALAACGGGDGDSGGSDDVPPVRLEDLCVNSGCGERTILLDIPGAENLTFSPDGRLFVSSGSGVFEIHKNADGSFRADSISPEACGYTGLAIRRGYLYSACGDGRFWATKLDAAPQLQLIHTMSGMCIANGTALGADGRIYVVDEPLNVCVPDPKIKRLTIDPADPMKVTHEEVFVQGSALGLLAVGVGNVLRFPNGLQADGRRFYGTDGGSIFTVDLQPDGSAGEVTPIFFEVDVHDDLGLAGDDGLLLANFLTGRITLISRDGEKLQATAPGTFSFPSSVRLGRPPMFEPTDILVTETGVLADQSLPLDHLSLFRRK
ncbi:hypothetical protein D0B54_08100 [Solimonas sp. K1W22B-7]|uniref:hypothetical protein n=1 Tax=Solimonas sp. K1W22B-7 TaxID=2303331 RepID=UPI000E32E2F3|nr:hypothetical protein [Solimonas sp. K1W22B-7]AXQ28644.1 hypothetical protein D0B54_08100 [Solimonas sp. K1W22B-7]